MNYSFAKHTLIEVMFSFKILHLYLYIDCFALVHVLSPETKEMLTFLSKVFFFFNNFSNLGFIFSLLYLGFLS